MNKKNYWIGLALSVLFLYLFLRKVDLLELWRAFHSVNYLYTVPIMAANVFSIWLRAVRWRRLLDPIKKIALTALFNTTAIGFMANNLFPARIGELVRAFVLAEKARISKTASLATIVVERLFDGFTILLLLLVVLLFLPFPEQSASGLTPRQIKMVGLFGLLFSTLVLTALVLLRFHNQPTNRFIGWCLKPLPVRLAERIRGLIVSFVSGLEILRRGKDIFIVKLYSLALWGVLSLSVYLLFIGFNFPLTLLEAFFLEIVLIFGVSIPSAPGFIGTWHWACAAGLMYLGIEPNLAQTFAIINWLCYFVPITLLGLLVLWREGMSLKTIQSEIGNTKSEHNP
ncbi:MAG: flippase-like domain-containing protein [Deltaproteobacteria bacterium]|nr:flippase-like domain-containing protein [Deltaproteobacteria bacterium]